MKEAAFKILTALMSNAKMSDREIGQRAGVSQPTVSRLRGKLETTRLIKGYAVIPDLKEIGYELVVISQIPLKRIDPSKQEALEAALAADSRVIYAQKNPQDIWTLSRHKNFTDYMAFNKNFGVVAGHYAATDTGIIKDPAVRSP